MNKSILDKSILGFVLINLIGCSNIANSQNSESSLSASSYEVVVGPGHGGGGNGTDGRAYESYAVDIEKLAVVQKHIIPIMERIESFNRQDEVDQDDKKQQDENIKSLINFKTWYFVPDHIRPIDEKVIGVSHLANGTQQLAYQTDREIWVDKIYFDQMNEKEQTDLILHELSMQLYMMRFLKFSELCNYSGNTCDPEAIGYFDNLYPPEKTRKLNSKDYVNIRAMTSFLSVKGLTMSKQEYLMNYKLNQFDLRFISGIIDEKNDDQPSINLEVNQAEFLKEQLNKLLILKKEFRKCSTTLSGRVIPCSVDYVEDDETFEKTFSSPVLNKENSLIMDKTLSIRYVVNKLKINLPENRFVQNTILSLSGTEKSTSFITNYIQLNGKSYAVLMLYSFDADTPKVGKKQRQLTVLLSYKKLPGSDIIIFELEGLLSQNYIMTKYIPSKVIDGKIIDQICYSDRIEKGDLVDQDIYVYNDPSVYKMLKQLNSLNVFSQTCF